MPARHPTVLPADAQAAASAGVLVSRHHPQHHERSEDSPGGAQVELRLHAMVQAHRRRSPGGRVVAAASMDSACPRIWYDMCLVVNTAMEGLQQSTAAAEQPCLMALCTPPSLRDPG